LEGQRRFLSTQLLKRNYFFNEDIFFFSDGESFYYIIFLSVLSNVLLINLDMKKSEDGINSSEKENFWNDLIFYV